MYDLLLKGGRVVDPHNGRNDLLDVAIKDAKIAAVAADLALGEAEQVIDATGLMVTPGLGGYSHARLCHGGTP